MEGMSLTGVSNLLAKERKAALTTKSNPLWCFTASCTTPLISASAGCRSAPAKALLSGFRNSSSMCSDVAAAMGLTTASGPPSGRALMLAAAAQRSRCHTRYLCSNGVATLEATKESWLLEAAFWPVALASLGQSCTVAALAAEPWAAALTHGHHKFACHHSQQSQLQLVLCHRNHCDAKQPPHQTGKLLAPVQVILHRSNSQQ